MKYRLTIYPAVEGGNPSTSFLFETKRELDAAANSCAYLLLFMQDKAKVMDEYSNVFVCEKMVAGEWEEIEE